MYQRVRIVAPCLLNTMHIEECLQKHNKGLFTNDVMLYCEVKNLILKISLNQLDKIIFFIKQRWSVQYSSICA